MLLLTTRNYWWPKMANFTLQYVKGCGVCQVTKPALVHPKLPLYPITTESSALPFSTIALDLIIDLPPLQGYDSILTITDHDITKAALFFPCAQTITREGVAAIYAQHVFPHYGLPRKVISDQDTHFTSRFVKELERILDITPNMSMAYHPQTDGQLEWTNQWLEQYLRVYGNFQQDDWARWLPMAQYVHNAWPSSTMGFTPFSLLLGFTPEITIPASIKSPLPSLEQKGEFLKQL